jgi:putative inorganic carbon (HCO3(-)) transporter
MQSVMGRLMTIDKAHNEYLNIAVSAGIPSLIAYLTLVFVVLKNSVSKEKNLLLAVIIAYLVQAFFNISVVSVAFLFWILLGRLVPYASKSFIEAD